MKKLTEKYYALRIGNFKEHCPYFAIGRDGATPKLFTDFASASTERKNRSSSSKVVRVVIKEL